MTPTTTPPEPDRSLGPPSAFRTDTFAEAARTPIEDNADGLTTCDACATLGPDEERPAAARIEWANGETAAVCADCLAARTWDEDDRLSHDDPAPQPWRLVKRFAA